MAIANETYAKEQQASPSGPYKTTLSQDGAPIKHNLDADMHAQTYAIMCATMYMAAARLNSELRKKEPTCIKIESADGLTSIVMDGDYLTSIFEPKSK